MAVSSRDRRRRGSSSASAKPYFCFVRPSRDVETSAGKKMCQGWADLPHDLLQSIIVLLRSPQETAAFAATCRPWYTAFSSSLPGLLDLFPPVLLRPALPDSDSNHSSECFADPTNAAARRQCRVPWRIANKMNYIGYSYGNVMYFHRQKCHLFDAFTGDEVGSPRLIINDDEHKYYYYPVFGVLTAPLASPDSHLLVQVGSSLFQWKVGSKSWVKNRLPFGRKRYWFNVVPSIRQVASFKGEMFALDSDLNLYRVCLNPRFKMSKVEAVLEEEAADIFKGSRFFNRWLVVCGDMLLLIGPVKDGRYQAVFLDMLSVAPVTRWVKVEKLDDWAVFVGTEANSQAFACKNPEKWGGRSNCVYFCSTDEPWSWCAAQLGETVSTPETQPWGDLRHIEYRFAELTPIWVFPGVFSHIRR